MGGDPCRLSTRPRCPMTYRRTSRSAGLEVMRVAEESEESFSLGSAGSSRRRSEEPDHAAPTHPAL